MQSRKGLWAVFALTSMTVAPAESTCVSSAGVHDLCAGDSMQPMVMDHILQLVAEEPAGRFLKTGKRS